MTSGSPFFGVSCWPGARAGVSVVEAAPGRLALSVHLDPINVVVSIPPFLGGDRFMVRFLRELAGSAERLADDLEGGRSAVVGPAHALRDPSVSAWFAPVDRGEG